MAAESAAHPGRLLFVGVGLVDQWGLGAAPPGGAMDHDGQGVVAIGGVLLIVVGAVIAVLIDGEANPLGGAEGGTAFRKGGDGIDWSQGSKTNN
jgi:hypothetical protein